MTIQMIVLWDSDAEPPEGGGLIYRWDGYSENGSVRSLLRYVESNGERLRYKYLAWIHDLGETKINGKRIIDHLAMEGGFSYWWMTLLVEKSHYKSPITDAIRLLALEEIVVQQRPGRLGLVSSNRQLHEAIRDLCQCLGIEYGWDKQPVGQRYLKDFNSLYRRLPQCVQALVSLARHMYVRWPLRGVEKPGWFGGDQTLFFCSYFDNVDPKAAEQARFHSYYWGGMHGLLNRIGCQTNWLQLFVPCASVPTVHAAMNWIWRFNRSRQNHDFHTFLDVYLSWRIILRVLKRWFWFNLVAWRLREIKYAFCPQGTRVSLWPLMRNAWEASMYGSAAINNLLWIELFDAALCDLPPQKKGLYLCENQGWERALIHAWRKHGHGCLIAVAHSTVRFWDIRYFADPRTIQSAGLQPMPQPDFVALNGKAAVDAYLSMDYPKEAIVECEALRYGYLSGLTVDRRSGCRGKILVLGDVVASATIRLLKLLEASIPYSQDAMTYVVKPHPNCPVRVEDFPSLRLGVVTDPLGMILQDYEVAYASNGTSAAVDAHLAGLPVVVMLDEADLNFSPLRGQLGVCFISTPEELAEALKMARQNTVNIRPDVKDFFFLAPELSRWSHLLAN